jgi:hypothetical protein
VAHTEDDGSGLDAERWFRHIAESKGVRHVEVVHEELFELR